MSVGILDVSAFDIFDVKHEYLSYSLFVFPQTPSHSPHAVQRESYHARTKRRDKRKTQEKTKRCLKCPAAAPRPQEAHQVPNTTGLMRFVSQFSRHRSLASRFTSFVFFDVRERTGKASREKAQFSQVVSHSSQSLSLSLSFSRLNGVLRS